MKERQPSVFRSPALAVNLACSHSKRRKENERKFIEIYRPRTDQLRWS